MKLPGRPDGAAIDSFEPPLLVCAAVELIPDDRSLIFVASWVQWLGGRVLYHGPMNGDATYLL